MEGKEKAWAKIVFKDGERIGSIKGEILDDEDEIFITIKRRDGKEFRINKHHIIKIEKNNFLGEAKEERKCQ